MKKGFTLIELLVVISIIALLSSIALASLNSARAKAADAAIKSNLLTIRSQSNIYFDTNGSYAGFLNSGTVGGQALAEAQARAGSPGFVGIGDTWWFVVMDLKTAPAGILWCVDSTGASVSVPLAGFDGSETSCADF